MKKKIVAMITAGAMVASMVSALPAYADESAASSTAAMTEAPSDDSLDAKKKGNKSTVR